MFVSFVMPPNRFGTDVMVTVAKKIDGPIKILFPRSLERNAEGKLDLSLLGLGDIVIVSVRTMIAVSLLLLLAHSPHLAYFLLDHSLDSFLHYCCDLMLIMRQSRQIRPMFITPFLSPTFIRH